MVPVESLPLGDFVRRGLRAEAISAFEPRDESTRQVEGLFESLLRRAIGEYKKLVGRSVN
jgi:hypothetical protein